MQGNCTSHCPIAPALLYLSSFLSSSLAIGVPVKVFSIHTLSEPTPASPPHVQKLESFLLVCLFTPVPAPCPRAFFFRPPFSAQTWPCCVPGSWGSLLPPCLLDPRPSAALCPSGNLAMTVPALSVHSAWGSCPSLSPVQKNSKTPDPLLPWLLSPPFLGHPRRLTVVTCSFLDGVCAPVREEEMGVQRGWAHTQSGPAVTLAES